MEDKNLVPTTECNPLDMVNENLEETEEKTQEDLAGLGTAWVPNLKVGYGTSKEVTSGLARPGEFIYAGQTNLGKTINVIALDYRNHAMITNSKNEVVGNAYHSSRSEVSVDQDEDFQAFLKTTLNKADKEILHNGADLFLFLPDHNYFATIFLKRTLASETLKLLGMCKGGRMVEVSTVSQTRGQNVWFTFQDVPTNKCLTGSKLEIEGVTLEKIINIPTAPFNKYFQLFHNPPKETTETVEEEGPKRDR